jgi:hypothetical protein
LANKQLETVMLAVKSEIIHPLTYVLDDDFTKLQFETVEALVK